MPFHVEVHSFLYLELDPPCFRSRLLTGILRVYQNRDRKTMAACKTRHFGSLPFLFPPQSLPLSPIHASTFARAQLFSTNACQLVKSVQSSRNRREANASQPSLKVISKEAMKEELPMDFGLLPMFIMPSGDRLPSLVYSTKDRLQLEWKRLKARFNDLRG